MKQVRINLSCAFFKESETFPADAISRQKKFMEAAKKNFLALNKKWNSTEPLTCNIEEINFTVPSKPISVKPTLVPVVAKPVIIEMDGLSFIYYPKRKVFVCESQRSLTLTIKEVKGLHEHNLLTVPKAHKAAFNYFAN